jgi:hypothetical protein
MYLELSGKRPFMYWANEPKEDCIERLFRYYEDTNILAHLYSQEFIATWCIQVKSIANAEK